MKPAALLLSALACLALGPWPAAAQDRAPTQLAFASGVAAGGDRNALALALSFEHAFTRYVGLELELAFVPGYRSRELRSPTVSRFDPTLPLPTSELRTSTDVLMFVTNVVAEVPLQARRVRQYLVAGGGVAHVDSLVDFRFSPPRLPDFRVFDPSGQLTFLVPVVFTTPSSIRRRVTEAALALGGGAGIEVGLPWRLRISGDVRYARLFTEQRLNVLRVSARLGCRF
ncbi:MAG TPA: hypothetical protein VNI83_08000 [Vicinamibacterales bacterium]|nr:hypothetical protein [Vicinamibacterales bacterium]